MWSLSKPRALCDCIGHTPMKSTLAADDLNERESQRATKTGATVLQPNLKSDIIFVVAYLLEVSYFML